MKITWKHAMFSTLICILSFIITLDLSQPYRMYVGIVMMGTFLISLILWVVSDLQNTGENWKKFKALQEDKDFVDYIETEFKKVKFNFNFKSQMVLGSRDINNRMAAWDKLKKEVDKDDQK